MATPNFRNHNSEIEAGNGRLRGVTGSSRLCVISLTYYRSDQSLCPLCLEWFLPLPRQQDCILEYILPTKPKRAIIIPLLSEKEGFI